MGMTKKQALAKIDPLKEEIEGIQKDLENVTTPSSVTALSSLLEGKNQLLAYYEKHASTISNREHYRNQK